MNTLNTNDMATKFDKGKPSFTSIPQKALLEVAKGFTVGLNKYGQFNYSKRMPVTRYLDALHRHLNQYLTNADKNDIDESNVHHLALVACNAMMALDSILLNTVIDDRNSVYITKDTVESNNQTKLIFE